MRRPSYARGCTQWTCCCPYVAYVARDLLYAWCHVGCERGVHLGGQVIARGWALQAGREKARLGKLCTATLHSVWSSQGFLSAQWNSGNRATEYLSSSPLHRGMPVACRCRGCARAGVAFVVGRSASRRKTLPCTIVCGVLAALARHGTYLSTLLRAVQ